MTTIEFDNLNRIIKNADDLFIDGLGQTFYNSPFQPLIVEKLELDNLEGDYQVLEDGEFKITEKGCLMGKMTLNTDNNVIILTVYPILVRDKSYIQLVDEDGKWFLNAYSIISHYEELGWELV